MMRVQSKTFSLETEMDKVNILGVNIDKCNIETAADKIINMIDDGAKCNYVFTPNSEILMQAYRDPNFRDVLNTASLLTADGIGVVYASKIVGNAIDERCAGFDTACRLMEKMAERGMKLYLFGSKPGVADKAGRIITERYNGINVVGAADGYFDSDKEKKIIADINEKKPNVLFVCLGAPKQEKWIYDHRGELDVNVCLGIGGTLDVIAGTAERAPEFYIKHNIEWLYRLKKNPSRIGRMMDLPKFAFTVLLHGKKYKQGGKN